MTKRSLVGGAPINVFLPILVIVVVVMVLVCWIRPRHPANVPVPSPVSLSEIASDSVSITPLRALFKQEAELVLFEGPLFSETTTTVYLYKRGGYVSADTIHGAYPEGLIEGTFVVGDPNALALHFINYPAIFAFSHATATFSEDSQLFSGEMREEGATSTRSFTLKRIAPRPGSVPIWMHHVKTSWESSLFVDVCDFEMEYPITDDQEVNKLIVRAMVGLEYRTIEDAAANYIQGCRDLSTDTPGRPHETSIRMSRRITAIVMLNQDGLLSLFFQGEEWGGGAHQVRTNKSVTIDLQKRRVVTLSDVIKPGHLQDFLTYEKQLTLDAAYHDFHGSQPISREEFSQLADFEPLRSFVSSTQYLSRSEQERRYGGLQDFYLTPDGLVKYYNSYDLGPWMNTPVNTIWYQGQPAFARDGVLKRLFITNGYTEGQERVNDELTQRLRELPISTATDTSRWLAYTSTGNRFSLRYPPTFLTKIDPNQLHQTQSSPDRPEELHEVAFYHPLPTGFSTSFLVQVTERGQWEKILPRGYLPLVSSTQWDEEKRFLERASPGDGCDFLMLKFNAPASLWPGSRDCRVIRLNGMTVLDRQMNWSPSTMVGRVYTFYRGERRYDINLPNGLYEYIDFGSLDRMKKGTVIEIGEQMVASMKFW